MASRAVETLLASRHERSRLHRIVVRVGATSAWVASAIHLVVGAFTGDEGMLLEAVGPLIAATLMTIQIIVGREDGGLALFGSGLIVAVWYTRFGDAGTIVPAAVALVLICALAMIFVDTHRSLVAPTLGVVLFWIPFLWDVGTDQRVSLGTIMAFSFAMAHFALSSIQGAATGISTRYQMLFEESPTAVLEEDWSEAVDYVRSEYTGKPERIRQFLLAYPAVVRLAVGKAKILRANEAAVELLEIDNVARFLGYRNPTVVTEENIEAWVSALVCLYEGGTTWGAEVATRRRSGELQWLESRSVDTSEGAPARSVVVALADITHLKERNDAMAEVVRAKDQFVAGVSHELRTPLTAVIGLTSELASSEMSDLERDELLKLVAGQAAEMSNIVEDLLVAARAEIGTVAIEPAQVDLVEELRATLEGLGIDLDLPHSAPPPVRADPHRVRQILRNLLTNADRYGGPNRRITAGSHRDRAWIEIRDDGAGIPVERAAQIFEPYFTSGALGSVGLGLAVARQLAELMGGTLSYERSDGETVFRLELPLVDRREPAMAARQRSL